MISFPPCKINLGLHVLSARSDGYHTIQTCFYPIPWYDILEIIPAKEVMFTCTGIDIPGKREDNICLRAYNILRDDFDVGPVAIHLHKVVPVGAGLGGGSSDAAHTLNMLSRLFELRLAGQELAVYAQRLGSDCAFFIHECPMFGTGRGEILSVAKISLRGKYMVLVYPNIHLSSTAAYGNVTARSPAVSLQKILTNKDITRWKADLVNDFEESVFKGYPIIKEVKEKLYDQGAIYASMSGSGSAVFGIFNSAVSLESYFPKMKYWSMPL